MEDEGKTQNKHKASMNPLDNIQKTEEGEDRFDEFAMGVKKKYRPDWLDSENKLFINKLNFVAKNYDGDHKTVSAFIILTT